MLKNFFRIPNTFEQDDRRRRQVLNILLIAFILWAIVNYALINFTCDCSNPWAYTDTSALLIMGFLLIITTSILFVVNRSPRIPSWLTGVAFIALFIVILVQSDRPQNLYGGTYLVRWAMPIMITAIVLRPSYVFITTMIVCLMMQFLMPLTLFNQSQANYYGMLELLAIAFISWLGMSIADNAIRDARRQAANNEAILKNIADGVLVLNQNGNLFSANPALLKMIPEDELKEIIAKPLGKTIQWKHKIFSVSISEVPAIGMVAVFRDDTRRRETERARDALLAVASHELRTPLTAVMNYLEMLQVLTKMGRINNDDFNEHIVRALENLKRLQSLVSNILDQAQIQAGALTLKHDTFNLRSMIEKAYQLLELLLKEKNLSYELAIAPDVPTEIKGDANRLNQVLVNLLGNAIKFTNEGSIRVKVSRPLEERLSIEVVDSGPGIPPEQQPDIFEAFRRGSNYAQRERQGAGLGLSIAKEIVTRMGGEISVFSEPGNGSTFTISLPMETGLL
jgi:signal transduction histidine kinase